MNTINELTNPIEKAQSQILPWSSVYAISAAIVVGISILAIIGFASPEVIHNAAHDLRHSMIFPCH